MSEGFTTHRRGFLGGLAAATLATGLPWADLAAAPTPMRSGSANPDAWLDRMTGKHRCLFDFPEHGAGLPLLHMLNYVSTYQRAYNVPAREVNAVGTLYFAGPTASLPLAFNDAMWAKYKFGETLNLTDPKTGRPSVRNMFHRPQAGDPVFFGGAYLAAGMESLVGMGCVFLLCENALAFWVSEFATAGLGTAEAINAELRANMVPGVMPVPAMVIAIEKGQQKGVAYNKQ